MAFPHSVVVCGVNAADCHRFDSSVVSDSAVVGTAVGSRAVVRTLS